MSKLSKYVDALIKMYDAKYDYYLALTAITDTIAVEEVIELIQNTCNHIATLSDTCIKKSKEPVPEYSMDYTYSNPTYVMYKGSIHLAYGLANDPYPVPKEE